jgi:hypothetical protein
MTLVDYGFGALALSMSGLLVAGVVSAARRAALPRGAAVRLGAGLGLAVTGWLAFTAALAAAGILARWDATPPRVALLPITVLATMILLAMTRTFGSLVEAAPPAWPIALQAFRLPVELLLWGLFVEGRIPERMTFGGRNLDVLVGLTAPLLAWAVSRGRVGRLVVAAWNVAGLGFLANIVIIAIRSAPGPLNAGWGGVPNTAIAEVPFVWLPAFLVPLAVFGHVVALRQLAAARGRAIGPRRDGAAST